MNPRTENAETTLADHVAYGFDLGWSFTPLSGKRPTLRGWQSRPRETRDDALAWASKQNVGLRTGSNSGIVVIDADAGADLSPLNLPGTVTVETGKNGIHLYYRCRVPIGNSAGRLGPKIDVRGDGGQVVFPGSIHPDTGRRYEWANGLEPWNVEIAELPSAIIDTLTAPADTETPAPAPDAKAIRIDRYVKAAIDREIGLLIDAGEGTRNDTLNTAAFNLGTLVGGGAIDRETIDRELLNAGLAVGLGRGECVATIRSGIEAGLQHPRRIETRPVQDANRPHVADDETAYTLVPGDHVGRGGEFTRQNNDTFAAEVLATFPAGTLYRKDFLVGEITGSPGRRRWNECLAGRMRLIVDRYVKLAKWIKSRSSGEQVCVFQPCSRDNACLIIDGVRDSDNVRDLRLIVPYPIYGPGFVRGPAGWANGCYYDEPRDLADIAPITDCEVIHNVLHDLTVDFPFKSEADRQNFFGLLLTPIVAPALEGNRPLHLIAASLERTGKTKLAEEVFGGVILGRQTPALQITDREEERDKRVIGLLLKGETMIHLDNLPPHIDSGVLSSLLTSTTYQGRLLGGNAMPDLPNYLTVVASGNNVQGSGEVVKRSVPIILQPSTPNPESRRDFQHPDLRGYVAKHRKTVLACLLGLVDNWIAAGKPAHALKLGGFESWAGTIGGILQVNGFRAWRTNETEWRRDANPKGAEIEAFVSIWAATYGSAECTPGELRDLASGADSDLFLDVFAKRGDAAIAKAFGWLLKRYVDAPIGEFVIRRAGDAKHRRYRLDRLIARREGGSE